MDDQTKKLVDEQMRKLPKVSQDAIKNSDWEQKVYNIGYKNGLLMDEVDVLYAETLVTMLGISQPENFVPNLIYEAKVSEEVAKKLQEAVRLEIFVPVMEEIQKHMSQQAENREERFESTNGDDKRPAATDMPSKKPEPTQASSTANQEPGRKDVLSDIENPPKSNSSISRLKMDDIFSQAPEKSESKKPEPTPTKPPINEIPIKKESLGAREALQSQNQEKETTSDDDVIPIPQAPKKYSDGADPYLEPID
jgi:hypothetical protein